MSRKNTIKSETEETLRKREAHLRTVIDNLSEGLVTCSMDGQIVHWNPAALAMHGFTGTENWERHVSELTGTFELSTLDGKVLPVDQWPLARILRGEVLQNYELRVRRCDQDFVRIFSYGGTLAQDSEGTTIGIVTITDVTERKQAEEAQLNSELRLAGVVDSAMDAIITINSEQRILLFNAAAEKMFLCSAEDALRSNLERFIPGRFRSIHQEHVKHFGESGVTNRAMGRLGALSGLRADGEEFPIEASISKIEIRGQRLYTVILRDITERKHAEQALQTLNAELESRVQERTAQLSEANRELESFAYSVSHDLRAPLRAVNGFSRILLEDYAGLLDQEGMRIAHVVSSEANRMGQLIDALLAFSRLGRQAMSISEIETEQIAREAFAEAISAVPDRHVKFTLSVLPPVKGDPTLLRQVFVNLFSNAIKFTRDCNPAQVEAGSRKENGETIFWVRDNGAGFDQRHSSKLFGVFQRLHRQDEFEGTGVGLAFVQRIIHRHGGRIWAESEPGAGATFFFTLKPGEECDQNV